jgi:hypothetical protein
MDDINFAEWYRRQGHHVIHTDCSFWYDAAPGIYQAFPFDWLIEPSEMELHELLLKHRVLSLRYSTPLEAHEGKVSYHVTLSNPYNLDLLRCQARNAVRRGLTNCQVECIPFERLAGEGWNLQQDTLDRQGRSESMRETDWKRICLSAIGLEGFEAWAAVVNGELAASIVTVRYGDKCYVPYALSHRKFLDRYVNNSLFYSVSCNMLAREGLNDIFLTVQSLDAPKSVDEFKFRMGFKAKAIRQRVVFHPVLKPFISGSTHTVITDLIKRFPEKGALRKAEGMIHFYYQGKLPLEQQEWPDCLDKSILDSLKISTNAALSQIDLSSNIRSSPGEIDGKP